MHQQMESAMFFAVIGRLEYDDDDTCMIIDAESSTFAMAAFRGSIRESMDRDDNRQIYITKVLQSDSPIAEISLYEVAA
jgi:hypothetical protein